MFKRVLYCTLGGALALGATAASAADTRSTDLHQQTHNRAQQTGQSARGAGAELVQTGHNAGGTVVHSAQTVGEGTHTLVHRAFHGRDQREQQLEAQTRMREYQTGQSARAMGHHTAGAGRDTGGMVVHGAQTTGNAVQQSGHDLGRDLNSGR
jgi:hypothetical protein